jgi:Ca2+-binding RTX toxin-like protein
MATITGTAAGETLTGTRFDDDISGLGGNDTIRGRAGNDRINGGADDDLMIGRTGNDHYFVDSTLDRVAERAGEGDSDTVFTTISYILRRNIEELELRGTAERGVGNDLENRIYVADQFARVDNVLNGRGGADLMAGGRGDDTYYVDDVNDVIEDFDENTLGVGINDTVRSTISFDLGQYDAGADVENLVLLGNAALDGTGGIAANRIVGNDADNVLRGLGGSDTLRGEGGDDKLFGGDDGPEDTLIGGAGMDEFYFEFANFNSADRLPDFSSADDSIHLDRGGFTKMPAGELPESAFVEGTAAQDADDRIVYDAATGLLYYDKDGSGAAEAIIFAVVAPDTEVNANDFFGYGG